MNLFFSEMESQLEMNSDPQRFIGKLKFTCCRICTSWDWPVKTACCRDWLVFTFLESTFFWPLSASPALDLSRKREIEFQDLIMWYRAMLEEGKTQYRKIKTEIKSCLEPWGHNILMAGPGLIYNVPDRLRWRQEDLRSSCDIRQYTWALGVPCMLRVRRQWLLDQVPLASPIDVGYRLLYSRKQ